ncbi:MAG: hypothetical protein ACTFAK_09275 [Candidatus Electronema sp. VV]
MTYSVEKHKRGFFHPAAAVLCCCGLLSAPAAFAAAPKTDSGAWHVRLTVKAEDGREDSGNVLGRLKDSAQGPDSHDLPEMPPPPPPMGDRYLSIVFPHPEWKTEMPDYSSDFRNIPAWPDAADLWTFEVRTHTPGIKAKLTWQGPAEVLQRSRIKEAKSRKVLVENCGADADAPVLLAKEPLAFIWEYQPQAAEKK